MGEATEESLQSLMHTARACGLQSTAKTLRSFLLLLNILPKKKSKKVFSRLNSPSLPAQNEIRSFDSLTYAKAAYTTDIKTFIVSGFPGGTVVKNPPANVEDTSSSPGPGRSHRPRSNEA